MRAYLIVLLVAMLIACSKLVVKETVPEKPVPLAPVVEVTQEENLYAKHYVARQLHGVKLSPGAAEPTIYKGVREIVDYQRMLNDGYDMLGYSSFEAGDVPPSLGVHVMQHSKDDPGPGVTVLAVIIGSPMEQAGVVVGDVLLSMGGEVLSSAQVLQQATHRHAGQGWNWYCVGLTQRSDCA